MAENIFNNCFNSKPIDPENPDGVSLTCIPIPADFPWDKMMNMIKLHQTKPEGEV